MSNCTESGMLRGRSCGGVITLIKNSLRNIAYAAITCSVSQTPIKSCKSNNDNPLQMRLIWDKADLNLFYSYTGAHLFPLLQKLDNILLGFHLKVKADDAFYTDLDELYNEIVHILSSCVCRSHCPKKSQKLL